MRAIISTGLLGVAMLAFGACGDSSAGPAAASSSSLAGAPSSAAGAVTPAAAGYSDACRLAALRWVDKATEAQTGFILGMSNSDLADPISSLETKIKVACGEGNDLTTAIETTTYDIAELTAAVTAYGKVPASEKAKANSLTKSLRQIRSLAGG